MPNSAYSGAAFSLLFTNPTDPPLRPSLTIDDDQLPSAMRCTLDPLQIALTLEPIRSSRSNTGIMDGRDGPCARLALVHTSSEAARLVERL